MIALKVFAVALVSMALGHWSGRRLFAQDPEISLRNVLQRAPWIYAFLWLLVVVSVLFFYVSRDRALLWQIPSGFQLYFDLVIWSCVSLCQGFIFGLVLALAYVHRHPDRHKFVVAVMAILGVVIFVSWNFTRNISDELNEMIIGGMVFQTSGVSCAAATGANIARFHGLELTEREVAVEMQTTVRGTSTAHIVEGMSAFGFDCEPRLIQSLSDPTLELPSFLFVDHISSGPESHAVALMEVSQGRFEIWDPIEGKLQMSKGEVEKIWHGQVVQCHVIP